MYIIIISIVFELHKDQFIVYYAFAQAYNYMIQRSKFVLFIQNKRKMSINKKNELKRNGHASWFSSVSSIRLAESS